MTKTEAAIEWMERTAADDSHGYSQINRWGPDYDCSSSVITAWQVNGVPVKAKGATYTGNMYGVFTKCGFKDVTKSVNLATGAGLKRGDVLLNRQHHVAMYCGNRKEVEASIDENGKTVGRLTGDQTGKEFLVRSYRNYPWTDVLRYEEDENSSTEVSAPTKTKTVTSTNQREIVSANGIPYRVMVQPLMMRTDADETTGKIVKAFHIGQLVYYYGFYKLDKYGRKWIYVTDFKSTGYMCTRGINGKDYLTVKER